MKSSQRSDIANENTLGLYNESVSKNAMQVTADPHNISVW